MATDAGPEPQEISRQVLRERYARAGEQDSDDVRQRVARALAQAEAPRLRSAWSARFLKAMRDGFLPAGRICAAAGIDAPATLISCFVQPVAEALPGEAGEGPDIATALDEAAATLRSGGGVGYDFSRILPRGAPRGSATLPAAGVVACLRRFDRRCRAVTAAQPRGGAQMGVLRWDHPDIEAFIRAKSRGGLTSFNLSVGITDGFMRAVESDAGVDLVHRAVRFRTVPARRLWRRIAQAAWATGDPGLLFLDRINADNNLSDRETLTATNPCGEQPLPAYGACCLGSMDLTRFVVAPFTPAARFDDRAFARRVRVAVRMLDNVHELSRWPLPVHEQLAHARRRVGLGFTGLGDALVMLGLRYDSDAGRSAAIAIARRLRDAAYAASIDLAAERGPFPDFDATAYLAPGHFASRLPKRLQDRIRVSGIRNAHLLAVAPTGSISLAFADNVSPGIEPVFAWRGTRRKRGADGEPRTWTVEDAAWRRYRHLRGPEAALSAAFVTASDIPASAHEAMVAAVAPYIDGSISKTVNLPVDSTVDDVADLFHRAWADGLKGLTVFRPGDRGDAVLCSTERRRADETPSDETAADKTAADKTAADKTATGTADGPTLTPATGHP